MPGAKFVSMKEKLKAQMLERRLEVSPKKYFDLKFDKFFVGEEEEGGGDEDERERAVRRSP